MFGAMIGTGIALTPLTVPTGTMNQDILGEIVYAMRTGDTNAYAVAARSFPKALLDSIFPIIGLAAAGAVTAIVSKKTGLGRATSLGKKWSALPR